MTEDNTALKIIRSELKRYEDEAMEAGDFVLGLPVQPYVTEET